MTRLRVVGKRSFHPPLSRTNRAGVRWVYRQLRNRGFSADEARTLVIELLLSGTTEYPKSGDAA